MFLWLLLFKFSLHARNPIIVILDEILKEINDWRLKIQNDSKSQSKQFIIVPNTLVTAFTMLKKYFSKRKLECP